MQKYEVNQRLISTLLSWVQSKEIAIPEIQRPFVWDSKKVRNLMDSLYKGFPIGYIIIWKNPNIKLKNGKVSEGKKIIIDGQQRIISLRASILGLKVINKHYKEVCIVISFNPITEEFATRTPATEKDPIWINDVSELMSRDGGLLTFVNNYLSINPNANKKIVEKNIEKLLQIKNRQIGVIELDHSLDIEEVTDIFVRINSEGMVLSQADFAMSKIASNENYKGSVLRKFIDYFSHLSIVPEFYNTISEVDKEFFKTKYFPQLAWLRKGKMDLYIPEYKDILRVAFTSVFKRGRLSDLVNLLSGRNFETRKYEENIARSSFRKLSLGVESFVNETNFKRFLMIVKSAGFIDSKLVRSKNVFNFAYILYLVLRSENYQPGLIESHVRRWLVLSILTKRYSGSPESAFDFDVKKISKGNFPKFLGEVERAELSDAFWDASLVQSLNTSVFSSPYFHVFLASQVKNNDKGFLSKDITVNSLIAHRGDIHHIFPRDYLKKKGLSGNKYNQIGNYVYMQSEINIKIGNKSPKEYFTELRRQIKGEKMVYGGVQTEKALFKNLGMNCIPEDIFEMAFDDYEDFLEKRRRLMAKKIKKYYQSL